ncbi:MAG: molybdate ABC transporter permease subunit [Proteobacteria bacterium]|nr:molybdate ABC transporter permease subunit [Pseudomonadota bacterium]
MNWLTPLELQALFLSLKVSLVSVGFSLPLGIFLAWVLNRYEFAGKSLLNGLVHLPLVIPPVVTGYLLLLLLGRNGVLGKILYNWLGITLTFNWKGAALASGIIAFPLLVRAVRISLESMDRGLEAAAKTLGAGSFRVFFTVTIPLIIPGIVSGAMMAFARSISEFGATITFASNIPGQTNTLPLTLYNLIQTPEGEAGAMRLCLISIATAMLALLVSEYSTKIYRSKLKG